MFFDIVLLNTQHGGRFGIAWLIATRGLTFVDKKQIKDVNLLKLCDDLKLFLISYSVNPKKRFSLRLSAILLNGVIKIFRQQAIYLQGDIFSLFCTVQIPSGIGYITSGTDSDIFKTPPTPLKTRGKAKPKRDRKVMAVTPEVNLRNNLNEGFLNLPDVEDILMPTARLDEISIREEMPKQPELIEDDFSLGVRPQEEVEEEMQFLFPKSLRVPKDRSSLSSSDSLPPQGLIQVVAQVHAPAEGLRKETIELPPSETDERVPTTEPAGEHPRSATDEHVPITEPAGEHPRSATDENVPIMEPAGEHPRSATDENVPITEPAGEHPRSATDEHVPITEHRESEIQRAQPAAKQASAKRITPEILVTEANVDVMESQPTAAPSGIVAAKRKRQNRRPLVELQLDELEHRTAQPLQKKTILLSNIRKTFVRTCRHNENEGGIKNKVCPLPISSKSSLNESLYNRFWSENVVIENQQMQRRGTSSNLLSVGESVNSFGKATRFGQSPSLGSMSNSGLRESSVQPVEIADQAHRDTGDTSKTMATDEHGARRKLTLPDQISAVDQINVPEDIIMSETPHVISQELLAPAQEPLSERIMTVATDEHGARRKLTLPHQISTAEQVNVLEDVIMSETPHIISHELLGAQEQLPEKIMKTPSPSDYKLRQQRIINSVAKLTPADSLTIEDVCERPINRLNIARAFSDLLTLSASGFVTLKSDVDSIELRSIEKGPKL